MERKAAIVIGVGKVGVMTPLKSAVRSAREMAQWLEEEGYDVECLTDEGGPVTTAQVDGAMERFVTAPPRYHKLLVYFTGHGYWQARSDIWLLSKAERKTSEAINLDGAIDLARYSGIPTVIFVSDACRSLPDARTGALVKGVDAFPMFDSVDTQSKIDVIRATSDATAAWEANVDGLPTSMLTHALRSAFIEPSQDMILDLNGKRVVPNRRLENYLQAKVNATLAGVDPNLVQRIEVNVPSSDEVYIAEVHTNPVQPTTNRIAGHQSGPQAPPAVLADPIPLSSSVASDMSDNLGQLLSKQFGGADGAVPDFQFQDAETTGRLAGLMPCEAVDHFESKCGFAISGAPVNEVAVSGGLHIELLDHGLTPGAPGVIRVWNDPGPSATVLVRLEDGRVLALAALPGYIGHVTVGAQGVLNVSYVPSSNHWRYDGYKYRRKRVDRLRAMVALAANENVFRVNSDQQAMSLADEIRVEKSLDPTLGLYAAHAYAQAGRPDKVQSVASYMRDDLQADLFDLHVLTTRPNKPTPHGRLVPFCPLLTQTWNLLRPRGVELPAVLLNASPLLHNSLWTTFDTGAWDPLSAAIRNGELR